jgi:RNA polymerase sigma factor (sigma-70 family)
LSASPTIDAGPGLAPDASVAADEAGLLYERFYDRIYGYCLYQLGSREEAEDAAQTTFMWAFRGLRRGIVPRAEASWLFTIAQNACRARHRTRGRRREREVLSDPQVLSDLTAAPATQPDELMGLEDALARMPELQRRAILLREWRGLSYREIAEELELSGAAVETLIFRARRTLAELLNGRPAPKRACRFAFDFGSIAAAIKSFLGTGTAAKVAAGLAATVVATTLAGSTEQGRGRQDAPPSVVAPSLTQAQVSTEPGSVTAVPRTKDSPTSATSEPAQSATTLETGMTPATPTLGSTLEQTVDKATSSLPLVPGVTGGLPLEPVTGTVDGTLDAATDALAPVTSALP